jgi:hypothetical protein
MKETYRLNRKVIDYENLLDRDISDELPERTQMKIKELQAAKPNKTLLKLQTTLSVFKDAFNWDEENIRYTFFGMLLLYWIEYILVGLTDIYLAKLSISFIMVVPLMIILFENESYFKIASIYELRNIVMIKLLIMLNKNFSFIQIVISSLLINFFDCVFIKKYYFKDDILGIEIKDKKLRKMNQFKFSYKFLICGYIVNTVWFAFLYSNLDFHLIDEGIYVS